jgi:hypothetical protein
LRNIVSTFDRIDFIKIDIEGTELSVLRSLGRIDLEHVNEIVIEIHKKIDMEEIKTLLEKFGFHVINHEKHWSAFRAVRQLQ